MPGDESEYEVEMILGAKVVKKRRKEWTYWVKWKNYTPEWNTWEPSKSFEGGSEHFIDRFWKRIKLDGRDPADLTHFTVGEEFFPSGPPAGTKQTSRKGVRKEKDVKRSVSSPHNSETEVQSIIGEDSSRHKRSRASDAADAAASSTKKRRQSSRSALQVTPERRSGRTRNGRERHVAANSLEQSDNGTAASFPRSLGPASRDEVIELSDDDDTSEHQMQSNHTKWGSRGEASVDRASTEGLVEAELIPSSASVGSSQQAELLLDAMELGSQPGSSSAPPPVSSLSERALPAHRARKANPKVKVMDEPNWTAPHEGAIATKRRFRGASSATKSLKPGRAGPGRSSQGLLHTSLAASSSTPGRIPQTVLSQETDVQSHHIDALAITEDYPYVQAANKLTEPPSGEELLHASGYNKELSDALPAFEDIDEEGPDVEQQALATIIPNSGEVALAGQPPVTEPRLNVAAWKLSTIFGPLTVGAASHESVNPIENLDAEENHVLLSISLDNTVSIPVILKDITPRGSSLTTLRNSTKGMPGKFYKREHAHSITRAVRPDGSAARLAHVEDQSRQDYRRFLNCLQDGDLFVSVVGGHLLAMCSSENTIIGQNLEVPPSLLGLSSTIVVAAITVENPSVYADAAEHAEDNRW